jgi:glycosyltransferase involved in cell wall biosynthesis
MLNDLPDPGTDHTGWPWTVGPTRMADTLPGGHSWPRMSIITPSYNQGEFLEETIRSVLLQGYPNLEYIIIDGGSTDHSVEIIHKYEPWLAYWVSEPDRGQSHAINKGLARTTGEILAWLNSDDLYEPDVFVLVAERLMAPTGSAVVFGDALVIDDHGRLVHLYRGVDRPLYRKLCYWRGWDIPQPTVFWRRQVYGQVGPLDESLDLALDYEWFLRVSQRYCFEHLHHVLARYRFHRRSKTGDWKQTRIEFFREQHPISRRYWPGLPRLQRWLVQASYTRYCSQSAARTLIHRARASLETGLASVVREDGAEG